MKAIMNDSAVLLGTSLKLDAGQTVDVTPAANQPGTGKWFAAALDWTNGDSIMVERDDFTLTIESQLEELTPQWRKLVESLIPEIADDYRATDDPDDDVPGMCLTIGFTPETLEEDASWSYQTGDNSYSGGAYHHPHWAVIYLYRDSSAEELASEAAEQIAELIQ